MPEGLRRAPLLNPYGRFLHRLARLKAEPAQSSWTCFLRNRAEIAYIAALGRSVRAGGRLSVAIFGCSTGAEAFSASYALRDQVGRIEIRIFASDILADNIAAAKAGRFEIAGKETENLSPEEIDALFEKRGEAYHVRERWRRPIDFAIVDATAPDIARFGQFDVVIANKFLIHMPPRVARACLRNLVSVIRPGGVLLVSGVDLDVKTEIVRELGLLPDVAAIGALHEGDATLRRSWPLDYWGLEPLNRRRKDFDLRYAVAFNKPGANPFRRDGATEQEVVAKSA